ncbi:hypothetical protein PR048_001297 [Dryococelus australis]|uniref:DUF5641 domain-containing protein n=1 Tax=Dryococelus australis TaxID=614101 RepID=A0ABQ9IHY9_9NEOP|nr:hypothetical protein PR048_001297 [Dryococelus australis]
MGVIKHCHHGSDGLVRTATVRTPSENVKHSICKLCPLPVHIDETEKPLTNSVVYFEKGITPFLAFGMFEPVFHEQCLELGAIDPGQGRLEVKPLTRGGGERPIAREICEKIVTLL